MDEFERVTKELGEHVGEFSDRLRRVEEYLDTKEIEQKRKAVYARATISENKYIPASQEEKAFSTYLRQGEHTMDGYDRKALRLADNTLGGYLAPTEFSNTLIRGVTEYSPIRSIARVLTTSATTLEIPKAANSFDCAWVAEVANRTETTGLDFGMERITPHEAYALIKVSKQLLEDTAVDLDGFLMEEFGLRFAKLEGTAFVTGNTTGQPEGLLTNANIASANSGNGTGIEADSILDLVYSLPAEYRRNAVFVMNRTTALTIRKLKNNQNDYIWQPSYQSGQPDTLAGYRVVECPDMPDVANATYPVLFGDFRRAYTIVDRISVSVQRLVEKYAESGQVGFLARRRVGGQVTDANAVYKMLIAT